MEKGRKGSEAIVLEYVKALDSQDFSGALGLLSYWVHVFGPMGEAFQSSNEFVKMLKGDKGRYDVKKVFSDKKDVCVLYDYKLPGSTVFMSSWYQVERDKIATIRTVFDTGQMPQTNQQEK